MVPQSPHEGDYPGRESVQDFIRVRLTELGKSQRWFAGQVDLSQAQLNSWIRNKVGCSAEWIKSRAAKFAATLGCDESEILQRINASVYRRPVIEPQPLNKNMLRALAEDDNPTDELMAMILRVQDDVGVELSYQVCKEIINLVKKDP